MKMVIELDDGLSTLEQDNDGVEVMNRALKEFEHALGLLNGDQGMQFRISAYRWKE